jgi:hypothetical protein
MLNLGGRLLHLCVQVKQHAYQSIGAMKGVELTRLYLKLTPVVKRLNKGMGLRIARNYFAILKLSRGIAEDLSPTRHDFRKFVILTLSVHFCNA